MMMQRGANHANRSGRNYDADFIKNSITPLDFYQHKLHNTKLKSLGWNNGGLCPFHSDNKPGSFYINLTTGGYKCFSCGVAGSDIIAFTMALHALKFTEALAQLADDWWIL